MQTKTELANVLIKDGRKSFYIPAFIKSNAKTMAIEKLRQQFEELIRNDKRFYGSRTSEIFITLGTKTGQRQLKYYPKVHSSFYSHIHIL